MTKCCFHHHHHYQSSSSFNRGGQQQWKYGVFVVGASAATYLIAALVDLERIKRKRGRPLLFTKDFPFHYDHQHAQHAGPWTRLQDYWKNQRESQRTMLGLIGLNVAVFLGWRIPMLQPLMSRYFLHSTTSHPITLLTSTFSHHGPLHLAFNMLALYSFGQVLHDRMGREQFLAFYLTSGMTASLGSHLVKLWRGDGTRSLGASGALFAVAGGCAHVPGVNVSLIFLPINHSVPIGWALPGLMAMDLVGLVQRWQTFDHAAHLSGALTGYLLYPLSQGYLWPQRRKILHQLFNIK